MLGKGAVMVLNRESGLFKMVTFEQIPEGVKELTV